MFEILISTILFIGGAIVQHETGGAVTINIGYNDSNQTKECLKGM